jgi:Holliday junction resolvasome RuvABC DNA-binding subunit
LALELRNKAQKVMASLQDPTMGDSDGRGIARSALPLLDEQRWVTSSVVDDVRSALQNLGYKDKQYAQIIQSMEKHQAAGEELVLEVALKDALKQLSGHLLGRGK